MDTHRLAVKSFIVNDKNEILLIKRDANDVHAPSVWEIPGGRLDPGEDPIDGLKRETKEETGIDIEIRNPIGVDHFTRDDGQKITMIIFLCKPLTNSITLSREHTHYEWIKAEDSMKKLHSCFKETVEVFKKHFLEKD